MPVIHFHFVSISSLLKVAHAEIEEKHVSHKKIPDMMSRLVVVNWNHADLGHHVDDDEGEEHHSGELLYASNVIGARG